MVICPHCQKNRLPGQMYHNVALDSPNICVWCHLKHLESLPQTDRLKNVIKHNRTIHKIPQKKVVQKQLAYFTGGKQ